MAITVLLVEDHRLVREALRQALCKESDIEVVGEAGTGAAAIECVNELEPQVVVLDIGLPDMNGIEAAQRLRRVWPALRIVALSMYDDRHFVMEMLRRGVMGYVTKHAAGVELVHAIRAVSDGNSYFSPDIAHVLAEQIRDPSDGTVRLGRREKEVLRLVAQGRRSHDIGRELEISIATVEVHRRNIMRKLQIHSIAELTIYAVREGLIKL
jgi:DNA-binding NarL/FixJ family response regulator